MEFVHWPIVNCEAKMLLEEASKREHLAFQDDAEPGHVFAGRRNAWLREVVEFFGRWSDFDEVADY